MHYISTVLWEIRCCLLVFSQSDFLFPLSLYFWFCFLEETHFFTLLFAVYFFSKTQLNIRGIVYLNFYGSKVALNLYVNIGWFDIGISLTSYPKAGYVFPYVPLFSYVPQQFSSYKCHIFKVYYCFLNILSKNYFQCGLFSICSTSQIGKLWPMG